MNICVCFPSQLGLRSCVSLFLLLFLLLFNITFVFLFSQVRVREAADQRQDRPRLPEQYGHGDAQYHVRSNGSTRKRERERERCGNRL